MPSSLPGLRSAALGDLALHVADDDGVEWVVEDLTGWRGSPASTVQVTQRPSGHGGWATARPWLTPRQMELRVFIAAPNPGAMDAAYERLLAATDIGPVLLQVTEGSTTRQATVYRNGDVLPTSESDYEATYSVPLIAPDPRRYAADETVTQLYLPSSTGGLTFPITFPITFNATVISGTARLDNPGTIATPLRLVVYGPVSQPQITVTAGGTLWTLSYSGDIADGDWVDIDTEAATVLYNGQSSRRSLLSGDWPSVPPGGADIAFRSGTYSATARLVVSHRAAWM
ncbi:phage distal tail protein [Streptomyces sp. NPDC014801]|uniref:phage distal tail protein n=1 Tax=Streptomyces sp. NPDC014801 TaxID=3364916 RepID=UPI003700BE5D